METLCVDLGAELVRRGIHAAAVIPENSEHSRGHAAELWAALAR